ncbi:MAG: aspartate 1-decarboxylase [Syntrophobacterales bacterium]|jgi:aspartate 1-decarboxylase
MQRIFLKAKIHRARVTAACLDYEGSLSIDRNLMDQADIAEHEQVGVYNLSNGERFDTYALAGPEGSGEICLNGAAARKGQPGDLIIITTYALLDKKELADHQPKVILLDENNRSRPVVAMTSRRPEHEILSLD